MARRLATLTDFTDPPARQADWSPCLRRAIAALPPSGGDIVIPGDTLPYALQTAVLCTKDNVRLIGDGRQSTLLQTAGKDGLYFVPPQCVPDVSGWFSRDPVTGYQAVRPGRSGSLKFHGTPADKDWHEVRRFTVDMLATVHESGGWCGMMSSQPDLLAGGGGGEYRPSPWHLYSHPAYAPGLRMRITTDDYVVRNFMLALPRGGLGDQNVRVTVDLDTGEVRGWCDQQEVVVTAYQGALPVNSKLLENEGAPFFAGAICGSLGTVYGGYDPVTYVPIGGDIAVRGLRICKDQPPPPFPDGIVWVTHQATTSFMLTLTDPKPDEPTLLDWGGLTRNHDAVFGFGWCVRANQGWLSNPRLEGLGIQVPGYYGVGVTLSSFLDGRVSDCAVTGGAFGLAGGANLLPDYPFSVRDSQFFNQSETSVWFHRVSISDLNNVSFATAQARNALRSTLAGQLSMTNTFVNPGSSGAQNKEEDVFAFDSCNLVVIDRMVIDHEDGWGPQKSEIKFGGVQLDLPGQKLDVRHLNNGVVRENFKPIRLGKGLPAGSPVFLDGAAQTLAHEEAVVT